ncbi:MAG: plastocyanin/azurin family copper-binding protein [Gemmatimonas sp.]
MLLSRFAWTSFGTALLAVAPLSYVTSAETVPVPRVVVVKMIDKSLTEFTFEPSTIAVRPGDIVQFVQTGSTPHNIEFRQMPAGVDLGAVKTSPYLATPNQKYEITIDKKFVKGTYAFVCIPHEGFGMKGSLTITTP